MSFMRNIVTIGALTVLAGCATPSIRSEGDATSLNIQSITVDSSAMEVAITGRVSTITTQQVGEDVAAALTAELDQASDPEGVASDIAVTVETVSLAPPLTRAAAATSSITAVITVTEQGSGRTIVPPTRLTGNSNSLRAPGLIGLATTQSVDGDYRATLAGFASTVRTALFGPAAQ